MTNATIMSSAAMPSPDVCSTTFMSVSQTDELPEINPTATISALDSAIMPSIKNIELFIRANISEVLLLEAPVNGEQEEESE